MTQFTAEDIASVVTRCGLTNAEADELLSIVNSSWVVSLDLLHEYADAMTIQRGAAYQPRIDSCEIAAGKLWYIEPFCGSTTYVIETAERLIVVDTGFACYADELLATLRSVFPDYDARQKDLILTHMDMDHIGLLDGFENIWMSQTTYDDFVGRANGKPNIREQHPTRAPMYRVSSLLSLDREADISHMKPMNTFEPNPNEPLSYIGTLNIDSLSFAVYETSGGHVAGSIVLVEKENRILFTGDALVNPDMNDGQKTLIRIATEMLGSMNADSAKAKAERAAVFGLVDGSGWLLCPGHGFPMRV